MCNYILFILCQERDLKSYMDDCGGILSMTNVRVSLSESSINLKIFVTFNLSWVSLS